MGLVLNQTGVDSENTVVREDCFDLWSDFLTYAQNLNGNWLVSQQVFRTNIVPTAEENPLKFVKWVNEMVKRSGLKIKSRYLYASAIKILRKFKSQENKNKSEVSKAITLLLNAGLNEPFYAEHALLNSKNN